MPKPGYMASAEQFGPRELLRRGLRVVLARLMKVAPPRCRDTRLSALGQSE